MDKTIHFRVNGDAREVTTDPNRPLLEVLREDLYLTGTKYGCGEGQCHACTVLIDGNAATSCRLSIAAVEGRDIRTIEGVAQGEKLHPVQEAFLTERAFQCGFCTSGMIMGLVGLLESRPKLAAKEIEERMHSHICRCCHYPKISKAIRRAIVSSSAKEVSSER
jgi:aerobic-type carbon monoxide dehydrogenase small subunit (CoxS/CutS family)